MHMRVTCQPAEPNKMTVTFHLKPFVTCHENVRLTSGSHAVHRCTDRPGHVMFRVHREAEHAVKHVRLCHRTCRRMHMPARLSRQ